MLLSWLKRRRRGKIAAAPFPREWLRWVETNTPIYRAFSAAEQAKLCDDLRIFAAEKHWEGCNGLVLTDEMKVTVSSLAAMMIVGLDITAFDQLLSILIYPAGFLAPAQRGRGSAILERHEPLLGQAVYRGPVILSWEDVLWSAQNPGHGHNLVWHELAHQLDMSDHTIDGTPPLADRQMYADWATIMTSEFEQLRADARSGRETVLDPYGTKDEAEFFAVATEAFFDTPRDLAEEHPRLYELLGKYYRQDPAKRAASF